MDSYRATVTVAPDGAETMVRVTGSMTIGHAAQIKETLLQGLRSSTSLILDLEGVTEIDLIGLQFICSLHASATAEGRAVRTRGLGGAALAAAISDAGFQEKATCSRDVTKSCVWRVKETRQVLS